LELTLEIRRFNRYFAKSKAIRLMNDKEKGDDSLKNFGLTALEFDDLCIKLQEGNELLFETAFMTHFELAMKYLMRKNGATHNDAYDVVMDVLIEFRKRILDNKVKYGNLKFMFTQMCVQRYKREKSKKLDVEEYAHIIQHESFIDEEVFTLLDKAMDKLGEQCQKIIRDVYHTKISYKKMEKKYKKTAANLRKQKERCLTKLKMNLRQSLNKLK